jgi:hypothetical protein
VLIATLILMVILLGMVPLFTRSAANNIQGFGYTQVSNFAKSRAEEYLQYPFNSANLTVPGGDPALEVEDVFSEQTHEWLDRDSLPDGDSILFTRTTTVRQFGVGDLSNPLSGGTPPEAVHIKEITVTVEGRGLPGSLGTGKVISVRVMKSQ